MDRKTLPLLSVIIPVYNVEEYLCQSVDSVLQQDYPNMEIILIDDGSTDKSGDICDHYQQNHENVIVCHKQNGGLSSARNKGLELCHGEFVSFIDSDDYIKNGMYKTMMQIIMEKGVSVVTCPYLTIHNGYETVNCSNCVDCEIDIISSKKDFIRNIKKIAIQVWNKIYEKKVLDGFEFAIGATYEDIPLSFHMFKQIDKLAIVNTPFYCYRVAREGSTVSSFKDSRLLGYDFFPQYVHYVAKSLGAENVVPLAKIASEFFIEQYYECDMLRNDKNIKRCIYKRFKDVNKYVPFKMHNHFSKIFCISPFIFLTIKRIRNLFR